MLNLFSSIKSDNGTVTFPRPLSGQDGEVMDVTTEAYKVRDTTRYGVLQYAKPRKAYVACQLSEVPKVLASFVGVVEEIRRADKVSYVKINCNPGYVSLTVWSSELDRNPIDRGMVVSGIGKAVFREYNGNLYTQVEFPALQAETELTPLEAVVAAKRSAPVSSNRRARPPVASTIDPDDIPF